MLALLESDRPDCAAVFDLARSCVRTRFECQLPSSSWASGPWWRVALRVSLQLPLAAVTVIAALVMGLVLLTWALTWALDGPGQMRPIDATLLLLAMCGPVAASGAVAMGAGLTMWAARHPHRATAACVAAAVTVMAAVVATAVWSDPNPGGSLRLQRLTSAGLEALRHNAGIAVAGAATVGLVVSLAFRGLPLTRCVMNCTHEVVDGRPITSTSATTKTT
jgi:hypothetical protein